MIGLRNGILAGALGGLLALPALADVSAKAVAAAAQQRAQVYTLSAEALKGKSPGDAIQMMCDEDLPTQKSGLTILSRTAPPQDCDSDCTSKVTVKLIGGNCVAEWTRSRYRVGKGKTPALRWTIDDQTGGGVKSRYRFDSTAGIGLCPQSKNDPLQDLKGGRCIDAECQTYEWAAVNKRARLRDDGKPPHDDTLVPGGRAAIHFGIAVVDTQAGGQVCIARDPIIINRGP
jgi:hypothetical protein